MNTKRRILQLFATQRALWIAVCMVISPVRVIAFPANTSCPAGFTFSTQQSLDISNATCQPCSQGTYKPSEGSESCSHCPNAGAFSFPGSTSAADCYGGVPTGQQCMQRSHGREDRKSTWCPYGSGVLRWCDTALAPSKRNRYGHSLTSVHNFVVIFGGFAYQEGFEDWGSADDNFYVLDTAAPRMQWIPGGFQDAKPPARFYHTAVLHGSDIVLWGGRGSWGDDLVSPWALDMTTLSWQRKSTSTQGNQSTSSQWYAHAAVMMGDEMVVFGGITRGGNACRAEGWALNVTSWAWTQLSNSNLPAGLCWHSMVSTGPKLIVVGGYEDEAMEVPSRAVFELDRAGAEPSWATVTDITATGGAVTNAVLFGGRLLVVKGHCLPGACEVSAWHVQQHRWGEVAVELRNVSSAEAGTTSHRQAAVATSEKILFFGGAVTIAKAYALIEVVSDTVPESGTTFVFREVVSSSAGYHDDDVAAKPDARESFGAATVGDNVFVFGGAWSRFSAPGTIHYTLFSDTWRLHLKTATWARVSTRVAPSARHGHSMVASSEHVVLFGGASRYVPATHWLRCGGCAADKARVCSDASGLQSYGDTWRWDAAGGEWAWASVTVSPPPRQSHAAAMLTERDGADVVVVTGGLDLTAVATDCTAPFRADDVIEFSDVWVFRVASAEWSQVQPSGNGPGKIHHHAAVAYKSSVIISGGFRYRSGGNLEMLKHIYVLSASAPGEWAWREIAVTGGFNGRGGHSSVLVGSSVVIVGGFKLSEWEECATEQDVSCVEETGDAYKLRIDPEFSEANWTAVAVDVATALEPRSGHVSVLTDADLLVMGGAQQWVEDESVWKVQFGDQRLLPISYIVPPEAGSGVFMSLSLPFMSVLLPPSAEWEGAWVRAVHVTMEPSHVTSTGTAQLAVRKGAELRCSVTMECDALSLHALSLEGVGETYVRDTTLLNPYYTTLSVRACAFINLRCSTVGCVIRTGKGATVHMDQTAVTNVTSNSSGGGIALIDSRAFISRSHFRGVASGGMGGALVAHTELDRDVHGCIPADLTVTDSTFVGNRAGLGGGALFCGANSECRLHSSEFTENEAGGSSSGGAVLARSAIVEIDACGFTDNTAPGGGGGGVFWQLTRPTFSRPELPLCIFNRVTEADAALFGPCVASHAVGLLPDPPTRMFYDDQIPGIPLSPPLVMRLVDSYNQTVTATSDPALVANAFPTDPNQGVITRSYVAGQRAGSLAFEFDDLSLAAAWDNSSGFIASVGVFVSSFDPYTFSRLDSAELRIHFRPSGCQPGSVLVTSVTHITDGPNRTLGECWVCPAGGYSLNPLFVSELGERCLFCPIGATCDGGTHLQGNAGTWIADGNRYNLTGGCPPGTERRGLDRYKHLRQECKSCDTDGYFYILRPDQDTCQHCPAGLVCFGNDRYVPRVNGSRWAQAGAKLVLESCPKGYHVHGAGGSWEQECRPCPRGSECTASECVECTPCAAGSYKDAVATGGCAACPRNTFNPTLGAVDVNECRVCPGVHAYTEGPGAVSDHECLCLPTHYAATITADDNTRYRACVPCPKAAQCSDRTCSLVQQNLSCGSEGPEIVGTWERSENDLYHLVQCPLGFELYYEKPEQYSHLDRSMCVQCHVSQYHIGEGPCQDCPAGLRCLGGSTVFPRVENSTWVPDGDVYRLTWCPSGYYRYIGNDLLSQECVACPLGSECVSGGCDTEAQCTPCAAGALKPVAGPDQCFPCPPGSYSDTVGAYSWDACVACPDGATTSPGGRDRDDCYCSDEHYLPVGVETSDLRCVICPTGALCAGAACAFSVSPNMTCPRTGPITGEWTLRDNGTYFLTRCPGGYALVNSTDGTSQGNFSYANQHCRQCKYGTEYIIYPNAQQCQVCPPGLACYGNATVGLVVPGSEWELVDGVYHLRSCPAGYEPMGLGDPTEQYCAKCDQGHYCDRENCTECVPCPAGTYKHKRGPGECVPCPEGTYREEAAGTSVASCSACPPRARTTGSGHTSPYDCRCSTLQYLSYSAEGGPVCNVCPVGGVCAQGVCGLSAGNRTCPDGKRIVGDWTRGDDERFRLMTCPDGYALVNSTTATSRGQWAHDIQHCKPCRDVAEYILRPDRDTCLLCPPGLHCFGNSTVVPIVAGSLWDTVIDDDGYQRFSLVDCPTGYEAVTSEDWQHECRACPRGHECVTNRCTECSSCAAGSYKDSNGAHACVTCPMHTYSNTVGATALEQCRACPRFSFSPIRGQTSAEACRCDPKYYTATGLANQTRCEACPAGAVCSDLTCGFRFNNWTCSDGAAPVGEWERNEDGVYILVSCPDGYSLVNSSLGTSHGVFSPRNQKCVPCQATGPRAEYVIDPNRHQCQPCPPGLICDGTSHVTPTIPSEWQVVDDRYHLISCATGHFPSTVGGPPLHECLPCRAGEECEESNCTECTPCQPGTFKQGASALPCSPCPSGTYNPDSGVASRARCLSCGYGATTNSTGHTSVHDCTCGPQWFQMFDSDNRPYCTRCPQGATCPDGSCALAPNATHCPGLVGTWLQTQDTYRLVRCPGGYSLQNSINGAFSFAAQRCDPCTPNLQYVINPNVHNCRLCPAGLQCLGSAAAGDDAHFRVVTESDELPPIADAADAAADAVVPRVEGSTWVVISDIWVLVACPKGYSVFNRSLELQECRACPAGSDCEREQCVACDQCLPGTYKGTAGTYKCLECPRGTYSDAYGNNALVGCRKCPEGATTNRTGATLPSECYCADEYYDTRLSEPFRCLRCPVGALCLHNFCALRTPDLTCEGGVSIIGEWEEGALGMYHLTSCPDGYELVNSTDNDATGEFAHDTQRCRRCSSDHYIIPFPTHQCQPCPRGLRCDGTGAVSVVVEGSEWVVDGDVYKLVRCPAGYRMENSSTEAQECVPCGRGSECADDDCTQCAACAAGTYKASAGPHSCSVCPMGTYNPDVGAQAFAHCRACPDGSTTEGAGQTSVASCACGESRYVATGTELAGTFQCVTCPVGGSCADRACAFDVENYYQDYVSRSNDAKNKKNASWSCEDGTEVIGTWERRVSDGMMLLMSCPSGYSLKNSTLSTSDGVFFHDGQRCSKCDEGAQYVLNPSTDQCQQCPPGLECSGNETVLPTLQGSVWVQQDHVMLLHSCPTGYQAFTAAGPEYQECVPCSRGLECTLSECVNCTACLPGAYKDHDGTESCKLCPLNTFGAETGASSLGQCRRCPDGAVTLGDGESQVSACQCDPRLYLADVPTDGLKCVRCPTGGVCKDGSCALALLTRPTTSLNNQTWAESTAHYLPCSIIGDWSRDSNDYWRLKSCPAGYSLVNTSAGLSDAFFSHDTQQCRKCPENTYILHPNSDKCSPCPAGLICYGDDTFKPKTAGAVWIRHHSQLVLLSCPPGHAVFSPAPELQQCIACGRGEHCTASNCTQCTPCAPGTFKHSQGPYPCQPCPVNTYNPSHGAASLSQCLGCPQGAVTAETAHTSASACVCSLGYPSLPPQNESSFVESSADDAFGCLQCPQGATCKDRTCALNQYHHHPSKTNSSVPVYDTGVTTAPLCRDGTPIVGEWERQGPMGEYRLVSCPAGHSRVITVEGISGAEFYAPGQRCELCLPLFEYVISPDTDQCQPCPPGLECREEGAVPVHAGAVWETCDECSATGSVYVLTSCPKGYAVYNSSLDQQTCVPCGAGTSCEDEACVRCTACPAGKFKSGVSPAPCSECPFNTYGQAVGAVTMAQCVSCNGGAYTLEMGSSSADQCLCHVGFYPTAHREPANRRCLACPFGAKCHDHSCAFTNRNRTCPSAELPVGEWVQTGDDDGGIWQLMTCPDGYALVNSTDGTSHGIFQQSLQQCRPCWPGKEYVIDPNRHQCQPCPPGLICDGTSHVTPRTPNSTWVPDGHVYRLLSCGSGHRVVGGGATFDATLQACEACGRGFECPHATCVECTPCAAGSYKDTASAKSCLDCPLHTYSTRVGASSVEACVRCPPGSFTRSLRQTNLSACECAEDTYAAVHQETLELTCMRCPVGSVCLRDASCALSRHNFTCEQPDGRFESIQGVWVRHEIDQTFRLDSCPAGSRLIRSYDGTATGPFSHDAQQCLPCPPGTYIIDYLFSCQPCPDGLVCSGGDDVSPRVFGSEWVPFRDVLLLKACPTGYRMLAPAEGDSLSYYELLRQDCIPCGVGEECTNQTCFDCTPCAPGSYKAVVSPAACTACPLHTFGSETGLSACTPCPTGSGTLGVGQTGAESCDCAPSTYRSAHNFTSTHVTCTECPAGAICNSGFCALRRTMNHSCEDSGPIIGEWEMDRIGVWYLRSCPAGHMLVNATDDGEFRYLFQDCVKCESNQYILHPNRHQCQDCPVGLQCRGDDVVTVKVNGSVWDLQEVVETNGNETTWAETDAETYRLLSCPTGYAMITDSVLQQRCDPCDLGAHCVRPRCTQCTPCAAGTYKDTKSPQPCSLCPIGTYNPGLGATASAECRQCPAGSVTLTEGSVSPEQCTCDASTYVVDSPASSVLTCQRCPVGGRCADLSCGLRDIGFTCNDSSVVVGEWSRDNSSGLFRLMECPAGHSKVLSVDGTASGVFVHDAQQCKPCEAGEEYILHPNTDTCQRCPAGLVCSGNDQVVPRVNGSLWVRNGSIFELVSCPTGYSRFRGGGGEFDPRAQECVPCDFGHICGDDRCVQCDACPPGSYQDETGGSACKLCRVDTFQPLFGASTAALCMPCPLHAHTSSEGVINASACACEAHLYVQSAPGVQEACLRCPAGAVCSEHDQRACALGTWRLDSCPAGYTLVNSTLGSSAGEHSHDTQQCVPCQACSGGQEWCGTAEYVVDPNRFTCKACPYGAVCNGANLKTKDELDVLGARWRANEEGDLWLQACPVGYQLMNNTGYENQRCHECADGEYVLASDNPAYECHECPDGAQCPNGGPPLFNVQAVRFSFSIQGLANSTADYTVRQNAVIVRSLESTLKAPPGSVEITDVCDSEGDNCHTPAELRRQTRRLQGGGGRRLMQSAGVSIATEAVSVEVEPSQLLDRIQTPSFSDDLASEIVLLDPSFAGVQIPTLPAPVLQDLPASKGEVYVTADDGRALLMDCGVGHLLINDTFRLQHCRTCDPLSYSLDPKDRCVYGDDLSTGTGIQCATRECTRCPIGAYCAGGAQFEPLTESEWVREYNEPTRSLVYRLETCGPGNALARFEDHPEEDSCIRCPPGSYAMEFVSHNHSFLKLQEADRTEGPALCIPCVRGGICYGGSRVVPAAGYWRGTPMTCPNDHCDDVWTNECQAGYCRQLGAHSVGHDERGVLWRDRIMMYQCQPGMCEQNRSGLTESADSVNVCRRGHTGVLCGVCEDGYEMSGRECIPCDRHRPDQVRPIVYAASAVISFALAYLAAWRPLFYTTEAAIVDFVYMSLGIARRAEFHRPGVWGRFVIWLRTSVIDIIKIIFGFYQVAGLFVSKVNVVWPGPIQSYFQAAASLSQFDYFSLPVMSCMTGHVAYKHRLLITTMGIPLVILFLALPSAIAKFCFKSKFHDCHDQFMFSTLFFLFLVYTATVRIVFEAFACVDLGTDGMWMKADLSSVCPIVDTADPLTFWWALLCILLYPVGIPLFMYAMTSWYGVSKCVNDKYKRACIQALLDKFKMQNALPEKIAEKLYHDDPEKFNQRLKKYTWKIESSRTESKKKLQASTEVDGFGVDEFRKLLGLIGIHGVGFSEIQSMIDRYGVLGRINKDGIRVMIKKVHKTAHVLTGDEDPDNLDIQQLRELSAAGQFETTRYRGGMGTATVQKRHREAILEEEGREDRAGKPAMIEEERSEDGDERGGGGGGGHDVHRARRFMVGGQSFSQSVNRGFSDTVTKTKSFAKSAKSFMLKSAHSMRYNKYEKEELVALLLRRADRMLKQGELAIMELKWDGATSRERHAIEGLGFLINTYKCKFWWFELSEMARKLLMGIVMIFVFDGTHSQIAVGFVITMTLMCMHLVGQPYRNSTLGYMHLYSLAAQLITYFYGMSLSTRELDELGGDLSSRSGRQVAVVVLVIDLLMWLIPLMDFFNHVLPEAREITNWAKKKLHVASAEPPEQAETPGGAVAQADMVFDVSQPKDTHSEVAAQLQRLRHFVEQRKAMAAVDPADWNDPGSESDGEMKRSGEEGGYFIPVRKESRTRGTVEVANTCCLHECVHGESAFEHWETPCCLYHGCAWHWPVGTTVEIGGSRGEEVVTRPPVQLPEFEKDEGENLIVDESGNPIPISLSGGWLAAAVKDSHGRVVGAAPEPIMAPCELPSFQRDVEGVLVVDALGDPIPLPEDDDDDQDDDDNRGGERGGGGGGKEMVLQGMCCFSRCRHRDALDPSKFFTPCCHDHGCVWHKRDMGLPLQREETGGLPLQREETRDGVSRLHVGHGDSGDGNNGDNGAGVFGAACVPSPYKALEIDDRDTSTLGVRLSNDAIIDGANAAFHSVTTDGETALHPPWQPSLFESGGDDNSTLRKAATRIRAKQSETQRDLSPRKLLRNAADRSPSINLRRIESTVKQSKAGRRARPSMGGVLEKALMASGAGVFNKERGPSVRKEDRTPAEMLALESESLSFALHSLDRKTDARVQLTRLEAAARGGKGVIPHLPGTVEDKRKRKKRGKHDQGGPGKSWPAADVGSSDSSDDDFDAFWRGEVAETPPEDPRPLGKSRLERLMQPHGSFKHAAAKTAPRPGGGTASLRGQESRGAKIEANMDYVQAQRHGGGRVKWSEERGMLQRGRWDEELPTPHRGLLTPAAPAAEGDAGGVLMLDDGRGVGALKMRTRAGEGAASTPDTHHDRDHDRDRDHDDSAGVREDSPQRWYDDGSGVGVHGSPRARGRTSYEAGRSTSGVGAGGGRARRRGGVEEEYVVAKAEASPGAAVSMMSNGNRARRTSSKMAFDLDDFFSGLGPLSPSIDGVPEEGGGVGGDSLFDHTTTRQRRRSSSGFSSGSVGRGSLAVSRLDRRRSSVRSGSGTPLSVESEEPLQEPVVDSSRRVRRMALVGGSLGESFSSKSAQRSLWLQSQDYKMLKTKHAATSLLSEVLEGDDVDHDDDDEEEEESAPTIMQRMASLQRASQKNVFADPDKDAPPPRFQPTEASFDEEPPLPKSHTPRDTANAPSVPDTPKKADRASLSPSLPSNPSAKRRARRGSLVVFHPEDKPTPPEVATETDLSPGRLAASKRSARRGSQIIFAPAAVTTATGTGTATVGSEEADPASPAATESPRKPVAKRKGKRGSLVVFAPPPSSSLGHDHDGQASQDLLATALEAAGRFHRTESWSGPAASGSQRPLAESSLSPPPSASNLKAHDASRRRSSARPRGNLNHDAARRKSSVVFKGARVQPSAEPTNSAEARAELDSVAHRTQDVKALFRDLLKPHRQGGGQLRGGRAEGGGRDDTPEPHVMREDRQGRSKVRQMRTLLSPDDEASSHSPPSQPSSAPGLARLPSSQPSSCGVGAGLSPPLQRASAAQLMSEHSWRASTSVDEATSEAGMSPREKISPRPLGRAPLTGRATGRGGVGGCGGAGRVGGGFVSPESDLSCTPRQLGASVQSEASPPAMMETSVAASNEGGGQRGGWGGMRSEGPRSEEPQYELPRFEEPKSEEPLVKSGGMGLAVPDSPPQPVLVPTSGLQGLQEDDSHAFLLPGAGLLPDPPVLDTLPDPPTSNVEEPSAFLLPSAGDHTDRPAEAFLLPAESDLGPSNLNLEPPNSNLAHTPPQRFLLPQSNPSESEPAAEGHSITASSTAPDPSPEESPSREEAVGSSRLDASATSPSETTTGVDVSVDSAEVSAESHRPGDDSDSKAAPAGSGGGGEEGGGGGGGGRGGEGAVGDVTAPLFVRRESARPVDMMGGLMSGKLSALNKKTKEWEDRYCVLCTRMDDRPDIGCAYLLESYHSRSEADEGGAPVLAVHVTDADVKYKQGTVFTIKTTGELNKKGQTYFLSTNSMEELREWFEALQLVEGAKVDRNGQNGAVLD